MAAAAHDDQLGLQPCQVSAAVEQDDKGRPTQDTVTTLNIA